MKIRATTKDDTELVQEWIDADPEHRGRGVAEFFTEARPGATQFAVLDDVGSPVFFVTLEKVVRGHIQFNPEAAKGKNVKALLWLGGFLRKGLAKLGATEFITESRCGPLIGFLEKGLGMRRMVADYSTAIQRDRASEPLGRRTIEEPKAEAGI